PSPPQAEISTATSAAPQIVFAMAILPNVSLGQSLFSALESTLFESGMARARALASSISISRDDMPSSLTYSVRRSISTARTDAPQRRFGRPNCALSQTLGLAI